MKKFYPLILTVILLAVHSASMAQIYNSITSNPGGLRFGQGAFWVGGVAPPNPCTGCTINIFADVSMEKVDGTTVSATASTIQIYSGVTFTVNVFLDFTSTTIIVGSDATGATGVFLNDQAYLGGGSSIQLANINTFINANNDAGNTVSGPYIDLFDGVSHSAGIYGPLVPPQSGTNYNEILNPNSIGSPNYNFGNYDYNCDGVTPNTCTFGVIYGPATTGVDPAHPVDGLFFLPSQTLPVELVQFLASRNDDGSVKILWATAQEVNAGKYEVERSGDKGSWTQIGEVKARGNSSVTSNYTYTDKTVPDGTSYYRLKIVDLDGKFKYSPIAVIDGTADDRPLVIYRNPFIDQIRIKVNVKKPQTLSLTVSDMLGRNYLKQSYPAAIGDNFINLVPKNVSAGTYILRIQGNSYQQTVKMVKE